MIKSRWSFQQITDAQMVLRRKQQRQGKRHLTVTNFKTLVLFYFLFFFLVQIRIFLRLENQPNNPTEKKSNT